MRSGASAVVSGWIFTNLQILSPSKPADEAAQNYSIPFSYVRSNLAVYPTPSSVWVRRAAAHENSELDICAGLRAICAGATGPARRLRKKSWN